MAENFRSSSFTIILWVATVVCYFSYIADVNLFIGNHDCDKFNSDFSCRVTLSIVAWLSVFAQLSILGTSFVLLASAGNSVYVKRDCFSLVGILVGIGTLVICCICSYFVKVRIFFANTDRGDDSVDNYIAAFALVLGLLLLCFQIKTLFIILVPEDWYENIHVLDGFTVSGMAKAESRTKKAAAWKIKKMVQNAFQLHDCDASTKNSSKRVVESYGRAMLAYDATLHDREKVGGIRWTFLKMWDGSIFTEEGIWVHSRLIASNFSQYFVALFYIILLAT